MIGQNQLVIALSLLLFGLGERAATNSADDWEGDDAHGECLSLMQRAAGLKDRLRINSALPAAHEAHQDTALFQKALVVSIEPEKYKVTEAELKDMDVPSEMVRGYNGKEASEVLEALQLLKEYGNAASLHSTVSNWMVCMHTSPGKPPNLGAAMSELWSNLFSPSPRDVDELLQHDHHGCVPKVIAIAAAHVRLWRDLASGKLPAQTGLSSESDPWYLVMEDDVIFCSGWRERMQRELPLAPEDAEVLKLFFFGHWRAEDQVGNSSLPGPFLEAKDPLRGWDLVTSALYELLHGAGWSKVPAAGFYAGTQAYLIRPSGARKLLENIRGKPFQDIDMTMMSSVKNYVWRRVLVRDRPDSPKQVSLLQTVPTCNAEPPKDQFRWSD